MTTSPRGVPPVAPGSHGNAAPMDTQPRAGGQPDSGRDPPWSRVPPARSVAMCAAPPSVVLLSLAHTWKRMLHPRQGECQGKSSGTEPGAACGWRVSRPAIARNGQGRSTVRERQASDCPPSSPPKPRPGRGPTAGMARAAELVTLHIFGWGNTSADRSTGAGLPPDMRDAGGPPWHDAGDRPRRKMSSADHGRKCLACREMRLGTARSGRSSPRGATNRAL